MERASPPRPIGEALSALHNMEVVFAFLPGKKDITDKKIYGRVLNLSIRAGNFGLLDVVCPEAVSAMESWRLADGMLEEDAV